MTGEETHPALCADLLWRREGTKLSNKLVHHGGFIGDLIGDVCNNARSWRRRNSSLNNGSLVYKRNRSSVKMASRLGSTVTQSLGSNHSLPCALRSRAAPKSSHTHSVSRRDVRVYAKQKTRVVRGPCYVTKDVSAMSCAIAAVSTAHLT